MALNSIAALDKLPFSFPPFVKKHLHREHTYCIDTILNILEIPDEILCTNNEKLTHLSRLLTILPETALSNFTLTRRLLIRIWHIFTFKGISRSHKQKLAEILVIRLNSLKTNFSPQSWMCQGAMSRFVSEDILVDLGQQLNWRDLFEIFEERFTKRGYLDAINQSQAKRQTLIHSVVRLASACRFLWRGLPVGDELMKLLRLDFTSSVEEHRLHYKLRMFVLFSSSSFWHQWITQGEFVQWWLRLCYRSGSPWGAFFSKILCSATFYGWAKGLPLTKICQPLRQVIFQLLTNSLSLPVTPSLPAFCSAVKETTPTEITRLPLGLQSSYIKLAKVIVLLLEPIDGMVCMDSTNSTLFNATRSHDLRLESSSSTSPPMWDYLRTLVSVFLPLTHPGDPEKWTVPIAKFVSTFITEYAHRIARERMSDEIVDYRVGRCCIASQVYSYRLGEAEDQEIISLFLPLILQGMHSKSLNACTAYECAAKQLSHINPTAALPILSDHLLSALETVTESHRLQSGLRLLTQLCPLILQHLPELISPLLNLTLLGIDASDPSKSVQVFTFYAVLFSQLKVTDCSYLNVEDFSLTAFSQSVSEFYYPTQHKSSPLISWQNYPPETKIHLSKEKSTSVDVGTQKDKKNAYQDINSTLSNPQYPPANPSESPLQFWSSSQVASRLSNAIVASSMIPIWADSFFTQVLYLSSHSVNVEKRLRSVMSSVDRSLSISLKFCLTQVLLHSDEALFVSLCERFKDWLFENVYPNSTDMMSLISVSFAQCNPKLALNILLKQVSQRVENCFQKAPPCIHPNSSDEKALSWFLKCFSNLLRAGPHHLFIYRKDIVNVIRLCLVHGNKTIARLGFKCLRRAIESCCIISLDPSWKPVFQGATQNEVVNSIVSRGMPWWLSYQSELENIFNHSIKDLEQCSHDSHTPFGLQWIIPDDKDLLFAQYLVSLGLNVVEKLKSCSNLNIKMNEVTLLKNEDVSRDFQDVFDTAEDPSHVSEKIDLPSLNGLDFNVSALSLSNRQIIQRIVSLCRQLLKALGMMNPDERPNKANNLVLVFPVNFNLAHSVTSVLQDICLRICGVYLGIHIDTTTYDIIHTTSLVEIRGTDDCILIRKLLKAIRQILIRGGCYWSSNGETSMTNKLWSTLKSYTASTTGVHHFSKNQELTPNAFMEQLLRQWFLRIELRRSFHPFTGYRRLFTVLTAHLGTHFYSQNRTIAQEILKQTFLHVYGGRHHVLNMMIKDLQKEILQVTYLAGSSGESTIKNFSESLSLTKEHLPSDDAKVTDSQQPIQNVSVSPEVNIDLSYARITGITYILNCPSMLLRLWRYPTLLKEAIVQISQCFKAPIERPQLQSRLFSLVHSVLNSRESLDCFTDLDAECIERDLILTLLEDLKSNASGNWRYQLVATCFLTVLNPPDDSEIQEKYFHWMLQACNSSKYFPLLNAVALFSVTLYLHRKLSLCKDRLPRSIQDALLSNKTVDIIACSLVHVHHENYSTTSSYPETVYQLVLQVVDLDKTWPTTRFPRLSDHLSLHNCLLVSTLIEAQKQVSETEDIAALLEPWVSHIEQFLKYPTTEKEYHVTCCEILAGILNRANTWNTMAFQQCWGALDKHFFTLFYALDQEHFLDFLDALRYACDVTIFSYEDVLADEIQTPESIIPFINFAMNPQASLVTTKIIKSSFLDFQQSVTTGKSTLEDMKRLKLICFVVQQFKYQANVLVECLLPILPSILLHPYNQIRWESARCLGFVLHYFSLYGEGSDALSEEKKLSLTTYNELQISLEELSTKFSQYFKHQDTQNSFQSLQNQRPDALLFTETLMNIVTLFFQHHLDSFLPTCFTKLFPLFFDALQCPDTHFHDVTTLTLMILTFHIGSHEETTPSMISTQESSNCSPLQLFIKELKNQLNSPSWKTRAFIMRLLQILGEKYRMKLYKTSAYNEMVEICIQGLTDSQSEVREASQNSLSSLCLSNSSQDYLNYANRFSLLAEQSPRSHPHFMGGVMGLAALVRSTPYHIPDWLPSTIVRLAQLAGHISRDLVRRHVENTLQEFFKTHCDAWNQCHVDKFSPSEIELLNVFKGRPHYFA